MVIVLAILIVLGWGVYFLDKYVTETNIKDYHEQAILRHKRFGGNITLIEHYRLCRNNDHSVN